MRCVPGIVLALALSATVDAAQIAARRYTVEEGLASNFVSRIYQDSHGYIWFGTNEGLSRFDGERLVTYGTADGLPQSSITAIAEDTRGRLWVATRESGISRLIDEPSGEARRGRRPDPRGQYPPAVRVRRKRRRFAMASRVGGDSARGGIPNPAGGFPRSTVGRDNSRLAQRTSRRAGADLASRLPRYRRRDT